VSRAVLLDVDGTLLDTLAVIEGDWIEWARRHALDPDEVFRVAISSRPPETFAQVAPALDPDEAMRVLDEIADQTARSADYAAFAGAAELLRALAPTDWALVTSNYVHRTRIAFGRTGLPLPAVIVDAAMVQRGKPHPEAYLLAAAELGRETGECLVLEDTPAGVASARAAGMTTWSVNSGIEADRSYATLAEAVDDVLAWIG
jgi:sugar-phosphatase